MEFNEKQELIAYLEKVLDEFDPYDIESYRLVITALFNNITIFKEEDPEINEITAKLLDKANVLSMAVEAEKYDVEKHFLPKNIRDQFRGKKLNDKFYTP